MKDPSVEYIDVVEDFLNKGVVIRSMFDKNDSSGVHIGVEGAAKIRSKICEFLKAPNEVFEIAKTPVMRKRTRSDNTVTPSSADRKSKHSKVDSPSAD